MTNCGDRREPIFRNDPDRQRFLKTLGEVCAPTDWQVHARCLMGNHFHLVIETQGGSGRGDEVVSGHPHGAIQPAHELVGHLFSGRYKALDVDAASPG